MTDAQYDYWLKYIRRLADLMELRDWTVGLKRIPPDRESAAAMIEPVDGRKRASIRLCVEWHDETPEQQRHYIVHELVHLHMTPADDIIRLELSGKLGQTAYDLLWGAYNLAEEYGIDALASVIAPHMPLPKPPKGGK